MPSLTEERHLSVNVCLSLICQQAFPLCCRYTVVNEINKVDLGEVSVFVYFIMKLSRVEGGSSYVGFHGGGSRHLSLLALQLASGKHIRATFLLFAFLFNA